LLWLLLVFALLLKSNRTRAAWMVLVPLAVTHAALFVLGRALSFAPDSLFHVLGLIVSHLFPMRMEEAFLVANQASRFAPTDAVFIVSDMVAWLVIALGVLWLLGHKLQTRSRSASLLLAAAAMTMVGVVGRHGQRNGPLAAEARGSLYVYCMAAFALLLGLALAGYCSRKRYSPRRFMRWLIFWTLAVCMGFVLAVRGVPGLMFAGAESGAAIRILMLSLAAGYILAITLYAIALPFMTLALRNAFYRARLGSWLNLEGTDARPGRDAPSGEPRWRETP